MKEYLYRRDETGEAVVHIITDTKEKISYHHGWYDISAFGISAGVGVEVDIDLDNQEPFCYYGGWKQFFEETYEESDKETFQRVYTKSEEIANQLERIRLQYVEKNI